MGQITSSEVRLDHSLNESERLHVANRRVTVQQCLKKHNIPCSVDEVPTIALLGSGGGERAMIGLLGSLSQLYEERLLDCTMYLSGVSGSTWCMASVYKEPDWSTNMETVKQNIIQRLKNGQVRHSQQYRKLETMCNRKNFSVTDIWAAFIVSSVVKEIDEHFLTEQRGQHTKDPYPIFTVIDKQCKYDKLYKDTWFEITPDECGYSLTGAFVDSKFLGSPFKNGAKTKEHPENDMLYLQGLCASALADEKEIQQWILTELIDFCTQNKTTLEVPNIKEGHQVLCTLLELKRCIFRGQDPFVYVNKMNELLKGKHDKKGQEVKLHGTISNKTIKKYALDVCESYFVWFKELNEIWTVLVKCINKISHWTWGTTYNFLYNMTASDVHPSILQSETRQYEDAGFLLNSPYFSVLRKARNVDLIISLDFSAGDPFETVDKAAQMCEELQIPFPKVEHHKTDEELKDFYVFKDNPNAPTVIHIPLFNDVNCKGENKMWEDRYKTFKMSYTDEMIRNLLEKAALNIKNTKEKLLKEIEEIIKRRNH